jgi:hypothetical protein
MFATTQLHFILQRTLGKGKCKGVPVQDVGFQEVEAPTISRQSANEGGKVASPTHRPPLPPKEIFLVLNYVRGLVDLRVTVRPEGLCQ